MLRTINATRYVTQLREGGSLPAIIEGDDEGMYVLKFRGAGQGPRALIAELLCGELARALGLPMPELVFVHVDAALGRNEPDEEVQDLVTASVGLNLALDFLPGALGFDPLQASIIDPALAARIVWFDAFTMNVDRMPNNPNLLLWHRQLYLIDHGAALYIHHGWANWEQRMLTPFAQVRDHVLLPAAGDLRAADAALAPLLTAELIAHVVDAIPEAWLNDATSPFATSDAERAAYRTYLTARLAPPRHFVEEAIHARERM
ncbi:MAG: aminotransferase class I and II [Candidatus Viridilinea halotolerans]|uniref:Aminotransferase class I and II n=1 Tax=Candidatus Viridilinea halotolerans TaxID=2491704 RepID=A0A426U4H2_9CHLR|nr:MAG: aminotransferase class I and II [Candidatus Viridilinea halotolerans]